MHTEFATEDDWQAFRDLRMSALTNAPEVFCSDGEQGYTRDAQWREHLKRATRDGNVVLIVYDDGVPVAMAGGKPNPFREDAFILHSLWVEPRARKTGVAKLLNREHARHAEARGYKYVQACCKVTNRPARAFYRGLGYTEMPDPSKFRPIQASHEVIYYAQTVMATGQHLSANDIAAQRTEFGT